MTKLPWVTPEWESYINQLDADMKVVRKKFPDLESQSGGDDDYD